MMILTMIVDYKNYLSLLLSASLRSSLSRITTCIMMTVIAMVLLIIQHMSKEVTTSFIAIKKMILSTHSIYVPFNAFYYSFSVNEHIIFFWGKQPWNISPSI